MTPYYDADGITLYHGDARELLDAWNVEDGVLVTDPPYGIAWRQRAYLTRGKSRGQRTREHPSILNDGDTSCRDEVLRIWGPKRPALVFGAADAAAPDGTRRSLIWRKPADAGLFGASIWRRDWEPIHVLGQWPRSPATESAVLSSASGSHRQYAQGVHPHAKPVDLMQRLLAVCPTGTIVDPFAGSGSTLVAAKRLRRRAIGVELDERYCAVAVRRLGQSVLDLWDRDA